MLQNEQIYNSAFSKIVKNYVPNSEQKNHDYVPYESINNDNFLNWDACHYHTIKEYGYDINKSGGEFIYAFFPMYSFIWKITGLNAIGMLYFNYALFVVGLLIIASLFKKITLRQFIVSLLFPTVISFMIPYTEALFFISLAVGIKGILDKNYWLFFIGFFITATIRPAVSIILLSFLCVEVYFLFEHKSIKKFAIATAQRISPLLLGTALIIAYQVASGANSIFTFAEVQSLWGKKLGIPTEFCDWSREGFGINSAIVFLISIPLFIYVIKKTITTIKTHKTNDSKFEYIIMLSAIYFLGITLYIILFQNGKLNGLFRYTLSTPFFYIIIYYILTEKLKLNTIITAVIILIAFLVFMAVKDSKGLRIYDLGFFITSLPIMLLFTQDSKRKVIYDIFLFILLVLNIFWTTYLMNSYVANGWIFT